ncbi:MAG: hypothetical protein KA968_15045, partial [Chitinophagaceae bacterium]|nr:hypothetical protein [Chitinophagaceae bacterium]
AKIKNFAFAVEDLNRILPTKGEVEKLEKQLSELNKLNEDITYLQQCRQYITDNTFKDEVSESINQLAHVLDTNDEAELEKYKKQLHQLKERYADWYLDLYLKHRISQKDHTQKIALLDSEAKAICDLLRDADFLSSGQYLQWYNKINKLQPADIKVNKSLILTAPYQDFNPVDYEDAEEFNVKQLKRELEELLEQWTVTLKETLDDPMVKRKINLLDEDTQKLLADFKTGKIDLAKENALRIRKAIMDLHKGLEKVELSIENMKSTFNKPLTPDEAIEAFKTYIDQIALGKERDKIRIILK